MKTDNIIVIVFWIICVGCFSMSIWGRWADKLYEKTKDNKWTWFWLHEFNVPTTRENCIRFVKGVSIFGLILMTTFALVVILL